MALDTIEKKRDLPVWIWLGLPLASMALRLLTPLLGYERWKTVMADETGLIENLTVLFLLPAVVAGVLIFLRRRELPRGIGWVMLAGGLAALYFAGEEISWGQQWFRFETPEALKAINKQGEFNTHNITNLLNNLPRQLMLIGTICCIILPLVLRRRLAAPEAPKSPWYWLIPNYRLVLISLMAVFLRLPHRLEGVFGSPPDESYFGMAVFGDSGEFKEYCFALVILFYLLSVCLRTGPRRKAVSADEGG